MKAIIRKEVHLPAEETKLLMEAAKDEKMTLKPFMESVLIAKAKNYQRKKLAKAIK